MKNKDTKGHGSKEQKEKTCFVIMPISDPDNYSEGHFSRVYKYLIKPACEAAGFKAIRADDVLQTNYIIIDVLRKIIESDIAICDISSKNPNVLYELGIRQAFNLPVTLIKDEMTEKIFDIQGFRYVSYESSLRADLVGKNINSISDSLIQTYKSTDSDINSLVQTLSIQPANISNKVELSGETSLIMRSLDAISRRMSLMEKQLIINSDNLQGNQKSFSRATIKIHDKEYTRGQEVYSKGFLLGKIDYSTEDGVFIKDPHTREVLLLEKNSEEYASLTDNPFE